MKELIRNILKEEEVTDLEKRFKNSIMKLQYIIESQKTSHIDSVEMIDIQYLPKHNYIEGKLIVKSYYEEHDFSAIGGLMDQIETEIFKIIKKYTFTENGGLIKKGSNNDWFLSCMPISVKWNTNANDPFMLTLDFLIFQDEYDA
jgi:hypothetical protein